MYIPLPLAIEKDSAWLIRKILESEEIQYQATINEEQVLFQLFVGEHKVREDLYKRLTDLANVEKMARLSVKENCIKKEPMSWSTKKAIAKNTLITLAILSTPAWMIGVCKMFDSYTPFYLYSIAHSLLFVMSLKKDGIITRLLERTNISFAYLALSMGMTVVTSVLVIITIINATL